MIEDGCDEVFCSEISLDRYLENNVLTGLIFLRYATRERRLAEVMPGESHPDL